MEDCFGIVVVENKAISPSSTQPKEVSQKEFKDKLVKSEEQIGGKHWNGAAFVLISRQNVAVEKKEIPPNVFIVRREQFEKLYGPTLNTRVSYLVSLTQDH